MSASPVADSPSYLFAGLAGEPAPGGEVHTGLYRIAAGDDTWQACQSGLPDAPQIRALAVHPNNPQIIYAGTQIGPYRSSDRGDHWEKLDVPDHRQAVWSILFHPANPDLIYIGCENCEIYRSDDAGEHWQRLPISVRFPDITTTAGANPVKRVLMLDASVSEPDTLFASIEVGGTLRSTDGGEHWRNLSEGQYLNDDTVDMHGILVSRWKPGAVYSIGRAGMFSSTDQGDHWQHVPLEPLNDRGQIYCRDIRAVPGNPRKIWVAAGGDFQSDIGVLLYSRDGGDEWAQVDMGLTAHNTMFALAFDERRPHRMACATNGGQIFCSDDEGTSWAAQPAVPGGTLIYSIAIS
jgi:photosystem II stability/assembly factor-like uncharacterized protein